MHDPKRPLRFKPSLIGETAQYVTYGDVDRLAMESFMAQIDFEFGNTVVTTPTWPSTLSQLTMVTISGDVAVIAAIRAVYG